MKRRIYGSNIKFVNLALYVDSATSSWKYNKLLLDIKSNDLLDKIEIQYEICIESNSHIVPYLLVKKEFLSKNLISMVLVMKMKIIFM